jgi:hypothetical protein
MADYAISNVPRRVVYANSGVGPYAFTFEILSQTDISVYRGSTLLTLTTDYSVIINANGTGSVTLVTAGTGNITIVGAKNIQRTSDFTTGGDLFANTLNDELDNQTIFIQQVAETAERGLKAPVTDPTDIAMTLPAKDGRKGKVLAFDSTTGNPVAGPALDAVVTVIEQSANINTVADNIASVNTVAGNTSNINTVAGVSSAVTTVSTNIANVNAVGADLLEGTSEINTVAVDIANVNNVGNNISNVNTVAGISANVTTVAGISSAVSNVSSISGAVTGVNTISSAVTGVNSNATNINAVNSNATNINAVNSNSSNINTVAGISSNINTVAGISANVTTVAGISSDVSTVATNNANVSTVATNIAAVNTNATNIVAIQNASTNATNAAASAVSAGNAQTAAEAARDATLTAYDNFDDRYLGSKTTDPTLDNDGNALAAGSLYFNSVDGAMKVYTGSAWVAAYVSGSGFLSSSNNLSDVSSASSARTNLGLGTISTQDASSVAVTGGSINGTTIGASTASTGAFTTLSASGVATVSAGTVSAPAITTSGDTNTGIFFPAADTIAFSEGGVESMRIDSSGRLGLSTTSPKTLLDIGSSAVASAQANTLIALESTGSSNWLEFMNSGTTSNAGIQWSDAGSLGHSYIYYNNNTQALLYGAEATHTFLTNSAERMRIDSSGNVGIGTSSPGGKLNVDFGNYTGVGARFQYNNSNTPFCINALNSNGDAYIAWNAAAKASSDTSTYVISAPSTKIEGGSGIFRFLNAASGTAGNDITYTERMRIGSAGQIGIGGANYGTSGQVLTSGGSGAAPSWTTISSTPTTAQVLTATAGASVAAIGSYAFLANSGVSISPGSNYAGNTLGFSCNAGTFFTATTGTWKAMGQTNPNEATVFLRVS